MSATHVDSNLARREFLRSAAAITTGYLVVGKPSRAVDLSLQPPGSNHVMTFDVTQTPMQCTISPPQTGANCVLGVYGDDVVHWKAKTSGQKHHLAVLFISETPFRDSSGNDVWAFHGSDSDEGNGIGRNAQIKSGLTPGQTFEFMVAVWDEDNLKTYTSDPTIIIGKGGSSLATAIAQLSAADRLLQKAAALQTPESANIKAAAVRVAAIISRLRVQLQRQAK